jgi:hypothetical protein
MSRTNSLPLEVWGLKGKYSTTGLLQASQPVAERIRCF